MRYDHLDMLPINAFKPLGKRMTLEGGGGKGKSPSPAPAPTSQTVTNTSIPEYARPYVEKMLGKSEALTDINQNPYQTYGGQRIADFSPLQQTAFQNVAGMQAAPQLGQATGFAGASGLGSLGVAGQMAGAGQQYQNMATNPYATQAYMSPYLSASLAPQIQELGRQFDITGQQQKSQATGMGAFGGNRAALMQSENMRNKNTAIANLIGQGYDKAFGQAQQAQQFGANLGLQGLQGALSGFGQAGAAAGTLGQLGQTQFGQQMGINTAQQQVGAVQQAQAQQNLDQAYQDFLKQKNYPYQQLAFMSDMVRGLPLSQAAQTVYQAPPSALSQLGGLGMAGLGAYGAAGGFKAEGGAIKESFKKGGKITYATGGNVESLSAEQLTELLDNPNLSPMEVEMIEKRLMLLTRMEMNPQAGSIIGQAAPQRSGIGAIATGDMVPQEFTAAGGGIVAFADKGQVKAKKPVVESKVPIPTNVSDYMTSQQRELDAELAALKGEQFGKSQAEQKAIADEIKASKDNSFYNFFKDLGIGTAKGTSQFTLSNLGSGAEYAASQQEKRAAQESANRKLLLQQQVEQEKSEFARRAQLAGMKQQSITNLMNKELGLQQIKATNASTAASRENANLIRAQGVYDNAVKAEKANLMAQNKNKYEFTYDSKELNDTAIANVNSRLAPAMKSMLGLDAIAPTKPKATDTTPAKDVKATVASPVVPMYAVNPKTKERIVSKDGGKTWNPL
jgi:hypothetical protein